MGFSFNQIVWRTNPETGEYEIGTVVTEMWDGGLIEVEWHDNGMREWFQPPFPGMWGFLKDG